MGLIKLNELNDCNIGDIVSVKAVLLELKEVDTTGKTYSQTFVTIEDLTDTATFPVWKKAEVIRDMVWEGAIANFYGTVSEYNGKKQFAFKDVGLLGEEERKDIDPNYHKTITKEQEELFKAVMERGFTDNRYKRLCEVAFGLGKVPDGVNEDEYLGRLDRFKKGFCSIRHHDSYPGGLFNHTMGVVRICLAMRKQYREPTWRMEKRSTINWEHMLALSLLHDYAKQRDYIPDEQKPLKCNYNSTIKLDHNIEGATAVVLLHNEIEDELKLSIEELELLRYGILCHAGQWGKFEPVTPEDKMFHCFDMIDTMGVDSLKIE